MNAPAACGASRTYGNTFNTSLSITRCPRLGRGGGIIKDKAMTLKKATYIFCSAVCALLAILGNLVALPFAFLFDLFDYAADRAGKAAERLLKTGKA